MENLGQNDFFWRDAVYGSKLLEEFYEIILIEDEFEQ